ncbi:EAL domain-containing protein [Devosia neptuniae]|jgi:diguanylate cyclase (GGDEF)-like protein|uniref:putative bifunctional diguanylate cyclase/phosphodiesterase n=1 Tax=Devosia TaxID=46913 RepID=UPI0022B01A23|nr:EAL domain-containing protein [Devosia neptuniae]MCZ4344910.1 EAL domain-containing protein [Devosia neptuniae]|tara:strand:+ start:12135 stop:14114 length:1980 start_codon:yes stop_codon:yes gene_type:complete
MWTVKSIKRLFSVPDDPELVLAQAQALSRQVPLMYAMVLVNTVILASTHVGVAPDLLAIYVPAILTLASLARIASWWRDRGNWQDLEKARRSIGMMMRVMPVLSVGFAVWTIGLLPYGDGYQQSQVVFFCGITTIGCMFCLMHVRAAALTMGALALLPFTLVMLAMNHPVLAAMAINLAAVVVVMLFVLMGNYRDFSALVASRTAMAQKQTETQRLSDENDRLANVDTLTGLPNRRSFDRHLDQMLSTPQPEGSEIAVVRLDLDSFKSVNEIFGQITGDRVLVEVARRLNMLRPPGTFVSRLGVDNFALVLSGPMSDDILNKFGAVLCRAMRSSFDLQSANIHLSASVGLATARPGDSAAMVYDRADYVTSLAKRDCRGSALVFAERHEHEISKVRRIEHELYTADLDAELSIVFQQQFDTALNCTTGYEVLARWNSPVLGQVSPVEFIPLAERTGVICRITQTVLRKALAASAKLPQHIRLSVNLSANDVGSTPATEAIIELVEAAGQPCRIDFEITETAIMRDMKQAGDALASLLTLGSRIALDDFGTGHSSLTHVQKLPLDRIKIDRSFVADIVGDTTSRAIVKTMVDMSHNLGISCVFEGVETQEQLTTLKALGGTLMQGYLFGRPVDEDTMRTQVAQEQASWGAKSIEKLGAAN